MERCQRTAVHVEPGQLPQNVVRRGIDGRVNVIDETGHPLQPFRCHHHGRRPVAGFEGTADDELALGDEEPVRRLELRPQRDVGQVAVVREPFVIRGRDLGDAQSWRSGCSRVIFA